MRTGFRAIEKKNKKKNERGKRRGEEKGGSVREAAERRAKQSHISGGSFDVNNEIAGFRFGSSSFPLSVKRRSSIVS